jgi:hypothetical protein
MRLCPTCASPAICQTSGATCGLYGIPVAELTEEHVRPLVADFVAPESHAPPEERFAWLVYDPDEDGAFAVVVATDPESAWLAALPDMGIEPGTPEASFVDQECRIEAFDAEQTAAMWHDRADLYEAVHEILRCRDAGLFGEQTPLRVTRALQELAALAKWRP